MSAPPMQRMSMGDITVAANEPASKVSPSAPLWRAFSKNATERNHERLWRAYQPLVRFIAEAFNAKHHDSFELPTLIDAGNVGLLDAIAEFDAAAGARFEPLAVPMIRGAITRSLAVQRANATRHFARLELAEAIAQRNSPQLHEAALFRLAAALRQMESGRLAR